MNKMLSGAKPLLPACHFLVRVIDLLLDLIKSKIVTIDFIGLIGGKNSVVFCDKKYYAHGPHRRIKF